MLGKILCLPEAMNHKPMWIECGNKDCSGNTIQTAGTSYLCWPLSTVLQMHHPVCLCQTWSEGGWHTDVHWLSCMWPLPCRQACKASTGAWGGQRESRMGQGEVKRHEDFWAVQSREGVGHRIWHLGWILSPVLGLVRPNLGRSELCQWFSWFSSK